MKNIHVLPTDKPSRLHLWSDEQGTRLETCELEYSHTRNTQHIYITSDEYIGLSYYLDGNLIRKGVIDDKDYWKVRKNYKKIILTEDKKLIKDGVQEIPDDFLERFVKKTSCERVGVEKWTDYKLENDKEVPFFKYNIIIPKEEPNDVQEMEDRIRGINVDTGYIKQETLEESVDFLNKKFDGKGVEVRIFNWDTNEVNTYPPTKLLDEYAKWQGQRMYSEEEVLKLLLTLPQFNGMYKDQLINQWFGQFKKK